MRSEKEIREEIKHIQARLEMHHEELAEEYPELYKSFATQCASKIFALEWVLNESFNPKDNTFTKNDVKD